MVDVGAGVAARPGDSPLEGVVTVQVDPETPAPVVAAVLAPEPAAAGRDRAVVLVAVGVHAEHDVDLALVHEVGGEGIAAVLLEQPADEVDRRLHALGLARVMQRVHAELRLVLVDVRVVGHLEHPDVAALDGLADRGLRGDEARVTRAQLVHDADDLGEGVVAAHATLAEGRTQGLAVGAPGGAGRTTSAARGEPARVVGREVGDLDLDLQLERLDGLDVGLVDDRHHLAAREVLADHIEIQPLEPEERAAAAEDSHEAHRLVDVTLRKRDVREEGRRRGLGVGLRGLERRGEKEGGDHGDLDERRAAPVPGARSSDGSRGMTPNAPRPPGR